MQDNKKLKRFMSMNSKISQKATFILHFFFILLRWQKTLTVEYIVMVFFQRTKMLIKINASAFLASHRCISKLCTWKMGFNNIIIQLIKKFFFVFFFFLNTRDLLFELRLVQSLIRTSVWVRTINCYVKCMSYVYITGNILSIYHISMLQAICKIKISHLFLYTFLIIIVFYENIWCFLTSFMIRYGKLVNNIIL